MAEKGAKTGVNFHSDPNPCVSGRAHLIILGLQDAHIRRSIFSYNTAQEGNLAVLDQSPILKQMNHLFPIPQEKNPPINYFQNKAASAS